jgi:iron complex transport system substrate-binding protein
MRSKRLRFPLALVALVLAACGSSSSGDSSAGSTSATNAPATSSAAGAGGVTTVAPATTQAVSNFPVTVQAANGPVTLAAPPKAIVSISPTATEMLFAIGAGDQVTAVDDQSNYPPEAPITDLSGFQPNVEAIAARKPDLVVMADDTGGLTASLGKLNIPVLSLPAAATFDDAYEQIEQLGLATGKVGEAAELVAKMQSDIDAIVKSVPERSTPLTYYHELDDTYFSATSKTFIGQVYALLGLQNIADEADKDGSGYPQLSQEYIIESNPDLIFLADTKCCHQDATSVAARPGWGQLKAITDGGVVALDDDIASRWGPRVVDYLRTVAEAVGRVQPVPAS